MTRSDQTAVNIGLDERKLRRALGILILVSSLLATAIFIWAGSSPWWGLILLPFYYQGVRFILDYRTGTCPLKAELGQRKLEATFSIFGEEIEDKGLAQRIRAKSRQALVQAGAAAVLLTALSILLIAVLAG